MGVMRDADLNMRRLELNDNVVFSKARSVLEAYAQQPETSLVENFSAIIDSKQVWAYCLTFTGVAIFFRFFVTEQQGQPRRMGMGPIEVQLKDRVVIFADEKMPFILRPHEMTCTTDDGAEFPRYTLIGVAYVHGIMDGVIEENPIDQDTEWENIYLR